MRMMIFWAGLLAAYLNLSGAVSPWAHSSEEPNPAPKDEGRKPTRSEKLLQRLAGRLQLSRLTAALRRAKAESKPAAKAAPANRYEAPGKPEPAAPAFDDSDS